MVSPSVRLENIHLLTLRPLNGMHCRSWGEKPSAHQEPKRSQRGSTASLDVGTVDSHATAVQ